jgi:hypothetical protein
MNRKIRSQSLAKRVSVAEKKWILILNTHLQLTSKLKLVSFDERFVIPVDTANMRFNSQGLNKGEVEPRYLRPLALIC